MRWFDWLHDRPRAGRVLVEESEAFLAGHLADRLAESGSDVPSWAWSNLLAHGSEEDLRLARGEATTGQWGEVRSHLAAEVLEVAACYGPLAEVQKAAMVPLELDLAAEGQLERIGPMQFRTLVETALRRYAQLRRRTGFRRGDSEGQGDDSKGV
jgi:hypothetical protein